MVIAYTDKLSDANFFLSSYLPNYKQVDLKPQVMHLFLQTAIYFDEYPIKFKKIHLNRTMKNQVFYHIDRYKFENQQEHKQVFIYVLHGICEDQKDLYFYTMNEQIAPNYLKTIGVINSQIAAVNKIVDTVNKLMYR